MTPSGIVIRFNVLDDFHTSFLEIEITDIRKFRFKCFPKTLYGLIVVGLPGTGHTHPEPVGLDQFLGAFGGVLTPPVAMEYGTFGSVGVLPHRHQEGFSDNVLCLPFGYTMTDDSSCREVKDSADIQLL